MRYSIAAKFLVILLCAISVVMAIGGCFGIIAMESAGLYVNDVNQIQEPEMLSITKTVSRSYATFYAVRTLSNLSYSEREDRYDNPVDRGDADYWEVKVELWGQTLVAPSTEEGFDLVKTYTYAPEYPMLYTSDEVSAPGFQIDEDYLYVNEEQVWTGSSFDTLYLYYYEAPEYTITVYLQEEALESSAVHILKTMYPYRYAFIALLVVALILFAAGMVYLCWAAGKDRSGKVRPGGFNRIPLDLYALAAALLIFLLWKLFWYLYRWVEYEGPHLGNLSLVAVNIIAMALPVLGWFFALAAQVKLKNNYLWHRSLIGYCLVRLLRGIRWLLKKILALIHRMPVIWQWMLTAGFMALSLTATFLLAFYTKAAFFVILFALVVLFCVVIVCYGGYSFGTLLLGVKKMTGEELSHKISTEHLAGPFRDCAEEVNALSETAMLAAENQLRSERTKSELITNVSHDIKTPLTSIINFVDLLKKPHTPEQEAQYLDVLFRQSARMKKLIEDLIELSKASTGNITVDIMEMDATESVNQALGEFSDKLEAAGLTAVFSQPSQPVQILADGRLLWRVLSNLLSNAIKYSLPGTRLYIELTPAGEQAILSLKNISRAPLNMNAEELMERFVRGDTSRNSEGSGLGLNIAASLMELQGGTLQLLADGDLFKVTLTFPLADRS